MSKLYVLIPLAFHLALHFQVASVTAEDSLLSSLSKLNSLSKNFKDHMGGGSAKSPSSSASPSSSPSSGESPSQSPSGSKFSLSDLSLSSAGGSLSKGSKSKHDANAPSPSSDDSSESSLLGSDEDDEDDPNTAVL